MLHDNLSVGENGHLYLCGADTVTLAEKYGTPLYLLDEDRIREKCRTYHRAMKAYFTPDSRPLYASKALSFRGIYRIAREEGMAVDVVSPGELYTALSAGMDAADICFHGNAKTEADIRYAIDAGVGLFAADSTVELDRISAYAVQRGITQRVLLRITPGIDPHTFDAVNTGKVDSKFGSAIVTGQAEEIFCYARALPGVELCGFHCHIGSQIFDEKPFCDAADMMLTFMIALRDTYGYTAEILNLGGGIGVRYTEEDPYIDIDRTLELVGAHLHAVCEETHYPMPKILMEPGRSLVADAGVTVYEVQNVKTIDGYKSYAAIDGGMTDNPRYALYRSRYTVVNASRASAPADFVCTVAGRCCESGDLIGEDIALARPACGEYLAVLVTGAYNYAMSSNYNCIAKPPIVLIAGGVDRLAVRRETFEEMTACQL
ncbi:MAG: diaminopimelate decarboxylase [Clostridia bacterium]|nr:diaminopimelate decarboxylase [Clostridia bacterium]